MKILEVRDGFVKFEADNSVYLSSFIQIDGIEKRYIAQVTKEFTFDILNNSINAKTPVIAGETLGKGVSIIIDASSFDKKMLASIDDKQENNIIARNLVKQFNVIHRYSRPFLKRFLFQNPS